MELDIEEIKKEDLFDKSKILSEKNVEEIKQLEEETHIYAFFS